MSQVITSTNNSQIITCTNNDKQKIEYLYNDYLNVNTDNEETHKQVFVISDRQKKFIQLLIKDVYGGIDDDDEDTPYPYFKYISDILDQKQKQEQDLGQDLGEDQKQEKEQEEIQTWEQLTYKQVKKLIYTLKGKRKVTDKQFELAKKINNDITDDTTVTRKDLFLMLNNVDKFNIRIEEVPLVVNDDYEYGYQTSILCDDDRLYYVKFYELMMLDYDIKNNNPNAHNVYNKTTIKSLDDIKEKLKQYYFTYRIYETYNGYHVFITSDKLRYCDHSSIRLMRELECDNFYTNFCFKYGYKLRLSKKKNRNEKVVHKFIEVYNPHGLVEDNELVQLLQIEEYTHNTRGFFNKSYLSLFSQEKDENLIEMMKDNNFRSYIIEKYKYEEWLINILAYSLSVTIKKPQRLIYDDDDYYIACDMLTHTYYICYQSLMMIDLDSHKEEINLDYISEYAEKNNLLFRVYASKNGWHLFLINKRMNHRNMNSIKMMLDLKCDYYYAIYSYIRGWSVRLNKKREDEIDGLYTYVKNIGKGEVDEYLSSLVKVHINLCGVFANERCNKMR